MNFYMLIEGKSTEAKVYPKLIEHYCSKYRQVSDLEDIEDDCYYIISGMGIPSLYDRISPSIEEIREFNQRHSQQIEWFLICLDTDVAGSREATYEKVVRELQKADIGELKWEVIL